MIRDHGSSQHNVPLNELVPPAVTDSAWQRTADSAFKALALSGCITVQLRGGGRHQAALLAAYDLLDRQLLPHSTPGQAGGVGCKDLGYKKILTYRSGPWPAGVLSSQQHRVLEKAMIAGQDVCAKLLTCIAASRGVRLPQEALLTLLDNPDLDLQRWSSSLLQAFQYSPAAAAAAGRTLGVHAATAAWPAEGPCAAHVDRSLLTLVYAPGQAGLQVRNVYGEWQSVGPLGQDQVLLMPGHTLEYALCGLLPAAQHRVVASEAGRPPRYSLTFKLLPAPSARIDLGEALDAAGHAVALRRYPPMTGADLMAQFSLTHDSVNASRGQNAYVATAVKIEPLPVQQLWLGAATATGEAAATRAQQAADTVALAASSAGVGSPGGTEGASRALKEEEEQATPQELQAAPIGACSKAAKRAAEGSSHRGEGRSRKGRRTAASQEAGRAEDVLQLVFRPLRGDDIILAFVSSSTVESAKVAYSDVTGIGADALRFIWKGKQLDNAPSLADCGLKSGDMIHVVERLRGD